jgi:hypothetical protein
MSSPRLIDPQPGAYLTSDQSRRAEILRLVLELVAGRSVPIGTVWDLARWINNGQEPSS